MAWNNVSEISDTRTLEINDLESISKSINGLTYFYDTIDEMTGNTDIWRQVATIDTSRDENNWTNLQEVEL